jgi:acetylornithine deacetylase/succinyl-diaminopimelate desuccinylase-like protein
VIEPDQIVSLVDRMVRIDSVLPREEALARFIANQIRTLGLEPTWQVVAPGRPNVYVAVTLGPRRSFVTLTGHLDTVPPARDWAGDPFTPMVNDGRLYGLGAVDMKAGLACAFAAFRTLVEASDLHGQLGRVGFAATVDEEGLGQGARALLRTELAKSDLVLLTEPFHGRSEDDPIPIAMTGKVLYRIRVRGRTTHGFTPERGVNAVDDASRIVAALDRLPIGAHALIGGGNYSTLKIEGGYREYAVIVPEDCEVTVTRLLVPGETRELAVGQLEELIASLGLESTVSVETPPPFYQPFELDPAHPAIEDFRASYRQVLGREPVLGGKRGIVDGNIYVAEGGIPTITFGPAGSGLHEAGEYVELATLEPVTRVLVETVRRQGARSGEEGPGSGEEGPGSGEERAGSGQEGRSKGPSPGRGDLQW